MIKGFQSNLTSLITVLLIFICQILSDSIVASLSLLSSKTCNMSLKRLPVLFLSHGGGPAHLLDFAGSMFAPIDKNSKSADFMRGLSSIVNEHSNDTPVQCILVVSAHWEESVFTVDYQTKATKLVYDYYGFPEESYAPTLTYPVKTSLKIANKIVDMLKKANIPVEKADRGFDHGVFIPLKVAYPEAKIPVVQLSLKSNLDMADHIKLGELLQPLRDEGVLIIASGQITHNLREIRNPRTTPDEKTIAFTEWVNTFLSSVRTSNYQESKNTLINVASTAPHFFFSHPRPEHFTPMAVAFGAGLYQQPEVNEDGEPIPVEDEGPRVKRIYSEVVLGSMAVDSYLFM